MWNRISFTIQGFHSMLGLRFGANRKEWQRIRGFSSNLTLHNSGNGVIEKRERKKKRMRRNENGISYSRNRQRKKRPLGNWRRPQIVTKKANRRMRTRSVGFMLVLQDESDFHLVVGWLTQHRKKQKISKANSGSLISVLALSFGTCRRHDWNITSSIPQLFELRSETSGCKQRVLNQILAWDNRKRNGNEKWVSENLLIRLILLRSGRRHPTSGATPQTSFQVPLRRDLPELRWRGQEARFRRWMQFLPVLFSSCQIAKNQTGSDPTKPVGQKFLSSGVDGKNQSGNGTCEGKNYRNARLGFLGRLLIDSGCSFQISERT
jgi:hypothetical protein